VHQWPTRLLWQCGWFAELLAAPGEKESRYVQSCESDRYGFVARRAERLEYDPA
jgi:hypothetical protein